jgi:hypothetical protein
MASAAPTSAGSVTLKAPYGGTPLAVSFSSMYGCGTPTTSVYPNFDLTNGEFTGSAKLSMRSCGSNNESGYLGIEGGLQSGHAFKTTTGTHSITVNWKLVYSISLATHTGAPGEYAGAQANVSGVALLYDETNRTDIPLGTSFTLYLNSSSPTTHSYSTTLAYTAAPHLVAGHSYVVVTEVEVVLVTYLSLGSTASASVNMGSSSDHATLTSILVP